MPRFRNDTGSVLVVTDLGRAVGPFEEFDWPGYDEQVHGVIPGCTRLDEPAPEETPDEAPASPKGRRGKAADENTEAGE